MCIECTFFIPFIIYIALYRLEMAKKFHWKSWKPFTFFKIGFLFELLPNAFHMNLLYWKVLYVLQYNSFDLIKPHQTMHCSHSKSKNLKLKWTEFLFIIKSTELFKSSATTQLSYSLNINWRKFEYSLSDN